MFKFIAALLIITFVKVQAATIELCHKDSDCDYMGDHVYCATISAESDGSEISLQTCVDAKDCGETETFQGGKITGKVRCGFIKDYWWVLVLGGAVLLGCVLGCVCKCRK